MHQKNQKEPVNNTHSCSCIIIIQRILLRLFFVIHVCWVKSKAAEEQASSPQALESCPEFSTDEVEDSMFDPFQPDPDIEGDEGLYPPLNTLEEEVVATVLASSCRDDDEDNNNNEKTTTIQPTRTGDEHSECQPESITVDRHWGSDPEVLRMREALRRPSATTKRPPIFLVPGLAASRLVAWQHKECPHALSSDVRVQDYVWLNLNMIMQMGTIDDRCFVECIKLGVNQTDSSHDPGNGCKLRPDEGLDAISSLSVGRGLQSQLMIGHTNTVYSWLIQWLSDNLGYDVKSIVGFPYDWRLSPDKLEERDGFLTFMRRRIETAVEANGEPGILVAHSMGNLIFRYFLSWLKVELTAEAYLDALETSQVVLGIKQLLNTSRSGSRSTYRYQQRKKLGRLRDVEQRRGNTTLWEEVKKDGEKRWREWIESHIWTYAGLSAPHLGAVNPLRAAISGETMGLPIEERTAREMEITFGSTLTVNPVSSHVAFCDEWDFQEWDEEPEKSRNDKLCLDDLAIEIQSHANETHDPWRGFAALKALMHERLDWDSDFPMVQVVHEDCQSGDGNFCREYESHISPRDVQNGRIFSHFSELWEEEGDPLFVKYEQLKHSFWDNDVPNMLSQVWERPPVKHVIMAYGTDQQTEVAYSYVKHDDERENMCKKNGGIPNLRAVLWEAEGGQILEERLANKGLFSSKAKREYVGHGRLQHSGDGSVPYISLSFAHLWLLKGVRSPQARSSINPLESIQASYRPKGGTEWENGIPETSPDSSVEKGKDDSIDGDTGTNHPHGTKYKPEMHRFHSTFMSSRQECTTTVIEASGVEHKETTRNYDILAAVFTDVLKAMHKDFDF